MSHKAEIGTAVLLSISLVVGFAFGAAAFVAWLAEGLGVRSFAVLAACEVAAFVLACTAVVIAKREGWE